MPNVNNIPTKIEIAKNLWVKSHINPGQYVRGRYGSSYLKHVQSWRSLPTNMNKNSDMSYEHAGEGGWIDCEKPGHHSCLELYEEDGNLVKNAKNLDSQQADEFPVRNISSVR